MTTLIKKTTYARSISLEQDEFDKASKMEYEAIEVRSMVGKLVRTLPCNVYSQLLTRAFLRLVKDDPTKKHYWVVNF